MTHIPRVDSTATTTLLPQDSNEVGTTEARVDSSARGILDGISGEMKYILGGLLIGGGVALIFAAAGSAIPGWLGYVGLGGAVGGLGLIYSGIKQRDREVAEEQARAAARQEVEDTTAAV